MLEPTALHQGRSARNHLLCVAQSNGIGRRIGDLAGAQGIVLHELSPRNASLEGAYLGLTRDSVEYQAAVPRSGRWPDRVDRRRCADVGADEDPHRPLDVLDVVLRCHQHVGLSAIVCAVYVAQYDQLTAQENAGFDPASASLVGTICPSWPSPSSESWSSPANTAAA